MDSFLELKTFNTSFLYLLFSQRLKCIFSVYCLLLQCARHIQYYQWASTSSRKLRFPKRFPVMPELGCQRCSYSAAWESLRLRSLTKSECEMLRKKREKRITSVLHAWCVVTADVGSSAVARYAQNLPAGVKDFMYKSNSNIRLYTRRQWRHQVLTYEVNNGLSVINIIHKNDMFLPSSYIKIFVLLSALHISSLPKHTRVLHAERDIKCINKLICNNS